MVKLDRSCSVLLFDGAHIKIAHAMPFLLHCAKDPNSCKVFEIFHLFRKKITLKYMHCIHF